jgi:hypothetical protein
LDQTGNQLFLCRRPKRIADDLTPKPNGDIVRAIGLFRPRFGKLADVFAELGHLVRVALTDLYAIGVINLSAAGRFADPSA